MVGKFCEPQASGIQSPGGAVYNSPAVEPRKGRNPGNRPKKQMRTPEGWYKVWHEIRHCFKMPQTPKTRVHKGSELRFATVLAIICRPTLRRFAPSLRAQFSFFTLPRGSAASPLHRRALLKFSGILLLFDVQSSTTEKKQRDRYPLFLKRGGARPPAWDFTPDL